MLRILRVRTGVDLLDFVGDLLGVSPNESTPQFGRTCAKRFIFPAARHPRQCQTGRHPRARTQTNLDRLGLRRSRVHYLRGPREHRPLSR
eukprot:297561-Pyramimonas_sp.AAC.1